MIPPSLPVLLALVGGTHAADAAAPAATALANPAPKQLGEDSTNCTARILVTLPERPPSRTRISFDRVSASPQHRELRWEPGSSEPLVKAVSLPAGTWQVSVDGEPFPFGSAGTQATDYGWRARTPAAHTFDVVGSAKDGVCTANAESLGVSAGRASSGLLLIGLQGVARPTLLNSARSLTSISGGSAPSATLARRSYAVDATTLGTELLASAGEVVIERAQVEGLEYVREKLKKAACEGLSVDPADTNLPPSLRSIFEALPEIDKTGRRLVLPRTCAAVDALRMDQLTGAGEALLRAVLQDLVQAGGYVAVDQVLRAAEEAPMMRMLEKPMRAAVDLAVEAISVGGVSDRDAQRVLVALADALTEPLHDPVPAALMLLDTLQRVRAPAPDAASLAAARVAAADGKVWTAEQQEVVKQQVTHWLTRRALALAMETAPQGLLAGLRPEGVRRGAVLDRQVSDLAALCSYLGEERNLPGFSPEAATAVKANADGLAQLLKTIAGTGLAPEAKLERLKTLAAPLTSVLAPRTGPPRLTADINGLVGRLTSAGAAAAAAPEGVQGAAAMAILGSLAKDLAPADVGAGADLRLLPCATTVVFAVVGECQAQGGCDPRTIGGMLEDPFALFEPGVCKDVEQPLAEVYADWGGAPDLVAHALDVLSPQADTPAASQTVAVAGIAFDVLDLALVIEERARAGGRPPAWLAELHAVSPRLRSLVTAVLEGKPDDALSQALELVADRAGDWIGMAGRKARQEKAERLREDIDDARKEATRMRAAGAKLEEGAPIDKVLADLDSEVIRAKAQCPGAFKRGHSACHREVRAAENKLDVLQSDVQQAKKKNSKAQKKGLAVEPMPNLGARRLADVHGALDTLASALDAQVARWEKRQDDLGKLSAEPALRKVVAFGTFAHDVVEAAKIEDADARRAAEKDAVKALSRATTDRNQRDEDWIFSLGGSVGTGGGLVGGGTAAGEGSGDNGGDATDEAGGSNDAAASGASFGWEPLHLGLGVALDHHTLFSDHWGFHLELTPVELGRFVDWSNGEGKVGIANPAEVVRPALAVGVTTGRPNVPIFLGVQGWVDPKLDGEDQSAFQGGASVLFTFYVPLFDIN